MMELKACPFCRGTEMHLVRYEQNGSLCCSGCGAQGPITVIGDASHEDATGLATATWNSRPDDQQSQATERLREAFWNLICLARPWMRDEVQQCALAEAEKSYAALSVTEPSAEGGVS